MSPSSDSGRPVPSSPGYDITTHLAATSTTETWEALQISLDRKVALLTPRVDALENPGAVSRFEDLSRSFARLHHRNFIQVIDISRSEGGVPYAVLERLEGKSLSAVLREDQNARFSRPLKSDGLFTKVSKLLFHPVVKS